MKLDSQILGFSDTKLSQIVDEFMVDVSGVDSSKVVWSEITEVIEQSVEEGDFDGLISTCKLHGPSLLHILFMLRCWIEIQDSDSLSGNFARDSARCIEFTNSAST